MAIMDGQVGSLERLPLLARLKPSNRIALRPVYEKAGPFEIRLAQGVRDLKALQRLRYKVFFQEGGAIASVSAALKRRDLCPFDAICDHLVVVDTDAKSPSNKGKIVGTYRLLRREVADRYNGFYSQGEFDIAPLLRRHPQTRFLELGRSCVHSDYRSKRVIELLWRGLWLYAQRFRVDALIGCASLPGIDVEALAPPLAYLLEHAQANDDWQVEAHPHCRVDLAPHPQSDTEKRRALLNLPPLIKAYLRTGARCGRHAVVDRQFGTTDVFIILQMSEIEARYLSHYAEPSCVSSGLVA